MLPRSRDAQQDNSEKPSMMKALKVPSIVMACYSVACAAASLGFLQATLEPHLREYKMNAVQVREILYCLKRFRVFFYMLLRMCYAFI